MPTGSKLGNAECAATPAERWDRVKDVFVRDDYHEKMAMSLGRTQATLQVDWRSVIQAFTIRMVIFLWTAMNTARDQRRHGLEFIHNKQKGASFCMGQLPNFWRRLVDQQLIKIVDHTEKEIMKT